MNDWLSRDENQLLLILDANIKIIPYLSLSLPSVLNVFMRKAKLENE
jgi:hypothetical protein